VGAATIRMLRQVRADPAQGGAMNDTPVRPKLLVREHQVVALRAGLGDSGRHDQPDAWHGLRQIEHVAQ
jgi:hypothetical protein